MSFAYLPLYTGDYLRDTRHLTPLRHGIYLLLLMHSWDQKGPLPLDEQECAGIANCRSHDEVDALRYVLQRFFVRMEDGWYNARMQREIGRAEAISGVRRAAGLARHGLGAKGQREAPASAEQVLTNCTARGAPHPHPHAIPSPAPEFNPPNPPASGREPPPEPPAASRRKKQPAATAEVPLPDWLDRDLWDTWHSTPKRRRATPSQRQLAIAKLTQWRADGLDWRQALESAALAGWQGLFKPEPARNGNGTGAQRESFRERDLRMARERFEEAAGRRPQQSAQIIDITPGAPGAPSLEFGS